MEALTKIAHDWAVRMFGVPLVKNRAERGLRVAEEAIELAQSLGISKEKMQRLVDIIYDKEPGHFFQEMGGVANTLAVLAEETGYTLENILEVEVRRVLNHPPELFMERMRKKIDQGIVG